MRRSLWWAQWLLFAGGVTVLAYCGFVLTDVWMFQHRKSGELERLLHDRLQANHGAASPALAKSPLPVATDGLLGRIEISRLGLSAIVMEGTDRATLRRAVGHIAGMALPGQPGNVGIAGHRDTFFRPLRNVRENDIIVLSTLGGEYRYRVVSAKIVGQNDVSVLASSANEVLTLVTCYPFYFVGFAPDRFIVRAERVKNDS